ncbi:oligosaccharide flippase family protein [Bacillus sp. REN3]|uniref:lipopolysaccharide biosynthesis protein n=1 Tax=Bacillus sp. REN3 TaxID=2802440 RepID=UPI001AED6AC5|nr:oligosaccharide flippase family protein [Bacillus sp. REN3]
MKKTSTFTRNITILMTGTALAQGLSLASAPLLSRLYSPSAFGILAVFTSIISILTTISTLKLELAIVLPKDDKEATHINSVAIIITAFVSMLSFSMVIWDDITTNIFNIESIKPYLILIPFSIFLMGVYNTLNYWSTRKKSFKRISVSQTTRSLAIVVFQTVAGFLKLGPIGLILGQLIGQLTATFVLFFQIFKDEKNFINTPSIRTIRRILNKYKDFPLYNAPQAFINSLSQNVPSFILIMYFSSTIVGFYAICIRLLMLPINLIGESVRRVYYQKAVEIKNSEGNVFLLYKKVTKVLAVIGLIPITIVVIFGPDLFSFVLGDKWYEAGVYARWMAFSLYLGFLNIPSVVSIQMYGLQRFLLLYEIGLLGFRIVSLVAGGVLNNPLLSIVFYSIVGFLFNSILIIFVYLKVRKYQLIRSQIEGA